jgi:hypothetical protein
MGNLAHRQVPVAERAVATLPNSMVSSTVKAAGLFTAGQAAVTAAVSVKVAAFDTRSAENYVVERT